MMPLLISIDAACRALDLSPKTGRNWLQNGRFPVRTVKVGSRRLIRVADLEAFVAGLVADQPAATASSVATVPATPEPQPQPRRRGRPTKAEALARAAAARDPHTVDFIAGRADAEGGAK